MIRSERWVDVFDAGFMICAWDASSRSSVKLTSGQFMLVLEARPYASGGECLVLDVDRQSRVWLGMEWLCVASGAVC